ncbi:hypothetical protein FACS1894159_05500 [Bacteroidia bacterium]|nr:hypothetical protein FACS1894159_05500 [Bacteroidia bacterium]
MMLPAMLFSCAKLDNITQENRITSFKIEYHQPQKIVIDDAVIEGDNIYIPILYGKYDFPMHLRASVGVPAGISHIKGLDFSQELTLDDIDSELQFFIVAASGTTRAYTIRPREMPLSENNYILDRVSYSLRSPEATVLSPVVHRVDSNTGIELLGVDLQWPVTIVPEFQVAEGSGFGAIWEGDDRSKAIAFQNGRTTLRFTDADAIYTLIVLSQSGLEREWKIALKSCASLPTGTAAAVSKNTVVEGKQLKLTAEPTGGQSPVVIDETMVENDRYAITAMISAPDAWPVSINVKYPARGMVDLIDMERDTTLVFAGWNDVKEFWLLDSDEYKARKWSIAVKEFTPLPAQRGEEAYLTGLTYTHTSYTIQYKSGILDLGRSYGSSLNMSGNVAYVYPSEKRVDLIYNSFQDDAKATGTITGSANSAWWRVTIRIEGCTFSSNTASHTMPSLPWTIDLAATGANQASALMNGMRRTFSVTSDDGTVSEWEIVLKSTNSAIAPRSGCDISGMTIAKVIPNYTLFTANPVTVDDAQSEIVIALAKDDGCYPMRIFPACNMSPGASILSQNYGNDPLVFDTPTSTQQVTVTSEDRANSRTYTVRLDAPEQVDGSDILELKIANLPPGFTTNGNVIIDAETGGITIPVTSLDAPFPLDVEYRDMEITENATASIADRGTLRFDNCKQVKQVVVTSSKGQNRTWYIRLDYRPQLRNWNLNSWNGTSPLPANYWANSNNSFTTNINPVAGKSGAAGDLCPEMKSANVILVGLAAGSFFVGWFDTANAISYGASDPVRLTFFGVPWQTTATIKGIMLDVNYHPGEANADWGSIVVSLINWNGNGTYVYHGTRPGSAPPASGGFHPDNTATLAAEGKVLVGTNTSTSYGQPVTQLPDGQWVSDLFIPVNGNVAYTHLAVVCSSSCYGDYFIGKAGSTLKVDNIRIVYE